MALVQAVAGSSANDYGLSAVQITTTAGNFLAVFAGWDVHATVTTAPVPVVYPSDSTSTNLWYHLGTSASGGYGSRSAIWVCPNAQAVTWVSCSLTAFASSLAYLVCEFTSMPSLFGPDFTLSAFTNLAIPSTQLFTGSSGTWQAPAGVTSVKAECWGGGGSGSAGVKNSHGGGGGGGGEYAAEPALAVTPTHSYTWTPGAGGRGAAGAATTFTGDSVTVTAHGGQAGTTTAGGSGGTGSVNTTHFNGGSSGSPAGASSGEGGAPAASATGAGPNTPNSCRWPSPPVGALAGTGGTGGPTSGVLDGKPGGLGGGGGGGGGQAGGSLGAGGHGGNGQVQLTWTATSGTLGLSGVTSGSDAVFAVFAAGSSTVTLTSGTPSGWMLAGTASAGTTDGVQVWAYWQSPVAGATSLTPSWTLSAAAPLSAVMGGIESSPPAPLQPNLNFPVLKVEAAFGFLPGDPSATPPAWTDITSRTIGKDGATFTDSDAGRQYELTSPEAGPLVIGINNVDGAFTPGNASSPWHPNVMVGTPIRLSAYWSGSWYPVAFGYAERWPQEWPDLPQWGLSKMTATDAIAVLSSATMPSALQGDILADNPSVFLPFSEQYLSYTNGFTPSTGTLSSYSESEAEGLIAADLARGNTTPGMYVDGVLLGANLAAATGQAVNLLGDQGTGFGCTSVSGPVTYGGTPVTGPGVIYSATATLPNPQSVNGVSLEAWFVYSVAPAANQGCTLIQAFSPPSSYWPTNGPSPGTGPVSFSAQITQTASTSNLVLLFNNGATTTIPFTPSSAAQHLVVAFTAPTAASPAASVYLNGTHITDVSLTAAMTTAWRAIAAGPCTYAYSANPLVQNFTISDFAVYPYYLAASRVASHYATAATGATGHTVSRAAARILTWGYLGIPRGGPTTWSGASDGISMGPFYSLGGTTAADGINTLASSDGGMVFAAPSGVLTCLPRWALFNLASKATFGDSPTGGEVPYLGDQAFDYDNTYLFNITSVTRVSGPTTSITATSVNTTSELEYFPRSPQTLQVSTTNDLDAYTTSQWDSSVYSQPQMRVRSLTVDASATQAFTTILSVGAGDVVTVNRRPIGGAVISGQFIVQKVSHAIGATTWKTTYQISPYVQQATVLQLDTPSQGGLGGAILG